MTRTELVVIERDVLSHFLEYCNTTQRNRFILVADENTYPILGKAVEGALIAGGADVRTAVLQGDEIVANEYAIFQVLLCADNTERTFLAVGSGTITDITRFASHRTRNVFISLPTAPSVDGFTSVVAPLFVRGLKITVEAHPPVAVFGDLGVLCAAPQRMIAAGFGDMIGKYISLADWKLGRLLQGEPYNEAIAERVCSALHRCVDSAQEIGKASEEGVRRVMSGLVESGFCMVDFGTSQPASGAEHHFSHYWEIRLLREGRPPILHGAKVGIGAVLAAQRYEQIRQMTREQLVQRLKGTPLPNRAQEIEHIQTGYGVAADQVMAGQHLFLDLTEDSFEAMKQRVIDHWDDIQAIAASVPDSQRIVELIQKAGGTSDPQALGLTAEDIAMAQTYAHYLRSNFTINKLAWMLGFAGEELGGEG